VADKPSEQAGFDRKHWHAVYLFFLKENPVEIASFILINREESNKALAQKNQKKLYKLCKGMSSLGNFNKETPLLHLVKSQCLQCLASSKLQQQVR
jgi:hypothetical protein